MRPWIWAPEAARVELEAHGTRHSCRQATERWQAPVELAVGDRYRFVVDGVTMPDPRSRHQPDGVHGPSAVVAAPVPPGRGGRPSGVDPALDLAVVYELHVGTFSASGTFAGAMEHLDELVELGVTHVEVMPIAAFDGEVGWGYDGVALFAPHPAYGDVDALCAFVDACHLRGLAVLVDVVHNHLGPSGNHLAVSGPYFTDRYDTPWGDAVNLDGPGSDGVRRFLVDNIVWWLGDVGFDGVRLDAVHALFDTSSVPYLEQLADEVRALGGRTGRRFVLIAESDRNDPRTVASPPIGPGLDAMWVDDFHHALHVALTGERDGYYEDYDADDVVIALVEGLVHQGRWSPHRHRSVGRPVDSLGTPMRAREVVASLQNHDQVGNRTRGDRISHQVGVERAGAAAALVLLSPFTALVFAGEEWAAATPFPYFSDHHGELGEAVRAGRRREFAAFGWAPDDVPDPQARSTFDSAVLDRSEWRDDGPHRALRAWYRELIRLRRTHPALADAPLPLAGARCEVDGGVVTVQRALGARSVALVVVANLGAVTATVADPGGEPVARWGDVAGEGAAGLRLAPGATVVLDRPAQPAPGADPRLPSL